MRFLLAFVFRQLICYLLFRSKVVLAKTLPSVRKWQGCGYVLLIFKKRRSYTLLKLRSGELRWLHSQGYATIGVVSPKEHRFRKKNKAGNSRWLGIKPHVRGTAKNPVDHPHGGGQGKTSGGRCSVTPWAKLTKGKRTRRKTKALGLIYRFRYYKK